MTSALALLSLAQVEPTAPLQLPVSYGGIAAIVIGGVVVLALVGFWLVRELQAGRAALVEEVRVQLESAQKPQSVEVQSPLTVTPHVVFVPRELFDSEITKAHGRMNRERDAAASALAAAEARMQAECARIGKEVATYNTNAEERANRINERIDGLSDKISEAPEKVVDMLVRTKGLIG